MEKGEGIMKVGYARVSTTDQNLDRQLEQLHQVDCKKDRKSVV